MRLPLTSQPHPYIQNRLVRYNKSSDNTEFPDAVRFAIYEFDEPARLEDIVMRLENISAGPEVAGVIEVSVYFEYKRTDVVLSDVTSNFEYEGSNYGSYLLRKYTYNRNPVPPNPENLEVMQGAFPEGAGPATAASSVDIVHEHMPSSIPANSRIVFKIEDLRGGGANDITVTDVVRATIGVVVSSGGMF